MLGAGLLVAAATVYCIGHGLAGAEPVPPAVSLAWAVTAVVPWAAALEGLKRNGGRPLVCGAIIVVALAASVIMSVALVGTAGPLAVAYRRLPIVALFAAYVVVRAPAARPSVARPPAGALPFAVDDVEFIQAAGNYVHVHRADRVEVHRVTMKKVERHLDPREFRRVHRSAIVRLSQIDRIETGATAGPTRVRMRAGRTFEVGARYRASLAGVQVPARRP